MVNSLECFYQFSSTITSTADRKELYRRVVETVRKFFDLDFSTLMLLSPDKERLIIYDTLGFPESMVGTFFLVQGQGLATHVVRTKQPEVVIDFANEPRFDVPPVVFEKGICSAICVPMMMEGESFGVLIGHTSTLRVFDDEEQALFQHMGNLAAVAIRNCLTMEKLRQAKEFTETILDSMTDAIAIIEVPQMRIVNANRTFVDCYGGSREAIMGRLCHVLTHGSTLPCGPPHCACPVAETLRQGHTCTEEHTHVTIDGKTTYVEIITSPIYNEFGKVVQVVHVQRDITARRRLESQLLQAQKMESVGRLAGGIAHDFNNILTAILGYSQLMQGGGNDEQTMQEYAKVIYDSGQRAAVLVRQILAFSRKQTLEMMPVSINGIINNLAKMMHRLIGEDVHFVMKTSAVIPDVLADVGQIEQVITNLVVNARDAMPDGGTLTIETSVISVAAGDLELYDISPGDYVALCVSDSGHGISKEIMGMMFEPFFTTKDVGRGTGLGLSTVYGIVKQHGGHLAVDSEPGKGTTFTIYLPVSAERSEVSAKVKVPEKAGQGIGTILVVDDDQQVRKMLVSYLAVRGFTLLEAACGLDAIEVSKAHDGGIDIVLTDVIMPDMNGKVLAQSLKEIRPDIKVIFMSGYTHNVIVHHGVLEQGICFLEKPLQFSKLEEMIHRCLS